MKYIPLNVKTEYDLMNSLIKIDELISYAKENNISSIGITDENMFSSYEFIVKCRQNELKPIIGTEIEIEDSKVILYAKDYNGFVSLCKIVSKKNIDTIDINFISMFSEYLIIACNYKDYN